MHSDNRTMYLNENNKNNKNSSVMDHVSWSRFEKKYIFESFSKRITVFTDEFLKLNIVVKKEVFTV